MIEQALFWSTVNLSIVNYVIEPVKKRYPDIDFWWLQYVSLATGVALSWFAEVNAFAQMPNEILARILTGLLVGGGSSLIYNIFDKPQQ